MASFVTSALVKQTIENHPDYKVMWRAGFAWKGAGEREIVKDDKFDEQIKRCLDWACTTEMKIDPENKIIHINGFSECDMF